MYKLTLTHSERAAIDWVEYRYSHGTPFYKLLCKCGWQPITADWDSEEAITFFIPESVAWEMRAVIAEDNFTCFAPALVSKLLAFLDSIV